MLDYQWVDICRHLGFLHVFPSSNACDDYQGGPDPSQGYEACSTQADGPNINWETSSYDPPSSHKNGLFTPLKYWLVVDLPL